MGFFIIFGKQHNSFAALMSLALLQSKKLSPSFWTLMFNTYHEKTYIFLCLWVSNTWILPIHYKFVAISPFASAMCVDSVCVVNGFISILLASFYLACFHFKILSLIFLSYHVITQTISKNINSFVALI